MARVLDLDQAAERLAGVSRRTVEREIAAGKIAATKIRGRVGIAESEIQAYIARQQVTRGPLCPSENEGIAGMFDFRSAANESSAALDRLLQKRTRSTTRRACAEI